jgi:regulatory protein
MTDNDIKIINNTINRLLAMCEYSRKELLTKLLNRNFDQDLCESQINKYSKANLLSEKRFAQVMVRSRICKGMGEQRIQRELEAHEISLELIQEAFSEQNEDWGELAMQMYVKKFGLKAPQDWQEQQKRNRILQYRGFSHEQIHNLTPLLQTHLSV